VGFNGLARSKAEIGCWILPEYWGKGIMKMVFHLVGNYGFTALNLD
jgi:ribosomal-protein-alanine N-acetyltransferase